MPNLLPEKEKKIIYSLYRNKLIILSLLSITLIFVISTALLLPSYLVSQTKLQAAQEDLAVLKESVAYREGRNTEEELVRIENEMRILLPVLKNSDIQKIYFSLLDENPENIRLTTINLRKVSAESYEVSLAGIADNRAALIAYANELKQNTLFKKVDLPISNLASDEDINFNLTISI